METSRVQLWQILASLRLAYLAIEWCVMIPHKEDIFNIPCKNDCPVQEVLRALELKVTARFVMNVKIFLLKNF